MSKRYKHPAQEHYESTACNKHRSGHTPGPWNWTVIDQESLMLLGPDDDVATQSIMWLSRCRACASRNPETSRCGWPRKEDMPLIQCAPDLLALLLKCEDYLVDNIMKLSGSMPSDLLKEIKEVTGRAMTCPVPALAHEATSKDRNADDLREEDNG